MFAVVFMVFAVSAIAWTMFLRKPVPKDVYLACLHEANDGRFDLFWKERYGDCIRHRGY